MDPATLRELANCQLLPQGKELTDLLSPELVNRLDSYITRTRISMSRSLQHSNVVYVRYLFDSIAKDWKRKRPMWILFLLTSLTRGEMADRGVPVLDLFMAQLAQRLGKQWGAVEEVTDQCDPLNGVQDKHASLALKMTLDGLEIATAQAKSNQTYTGDAGLDSGAGIIVGNNLQTSKVEINSNTSGPAHSQPSSKRPPESTSHTASNSKPVWKTAQKLLDQYNCGDISSLLLSDGVRQSIPTTFHSDSQLKFVTENTSQTLPVIRSLKDSPKHLQQPIRNAANAERTLMKSIYPAILKELEEYLSKELIVKRNEKMAIRIIRELNKARSQGKSAFFAIGAAHFIGSESTIIHYLQQAGYEITAVPRTLSEANREKSIDGVEMQDTDHLLRNRRKQTNTEELLNEYELPEFRPRFVNFENVWIRIEDFSPTVIASRRNQSRNGMSLETDRQAPYDINVAKGVASPNKVLSKDSWKSPKKERQEHPTKNDSSSRSYRFCFTLFSFHMLYNFIVYRLT
ncbi:hypothetical protein CRM22_009365 [Opisthorchis felineus]|nr:hypothetical protein CRM22_009365 [Opisthorchis felineus]